MRDGGQVQALALVVRQQVEGAPHAAQHSQAQHVHLHELQLVDVVLVPFDDLAVLHAGGLDRHQVGQGFAGQHETAGVLAEVAGEADQLAGEVERQAQAAVAEVQVQGFGMLGFDAFVAPAPDLAGQRAGHVFGQAQRLAHFAHGAASAVADHGGAQSGAVAAVVVVHPLDHAFALLMLEVHVDVGGFVALGGDEALEQQPAAGGVDAGDAQHVADGGIGGGAAALAQDVLAAGVADDAVHRQEIGGVPKLLDQAQLVAQLGCHRVRDGLRVAPGGAFPGQPLQGLLRGQGRVFDLVGVLIAQVGEVEAAPAGEFDGAGDGVRVAGEQPGHVLGRLQVPVGVALPPEPGGIDGAAFPDAGHHVLQDAPLRMVEQHVAGGDERGAGLPAHLREPVQANGVPRPAADGAGEVGASGRVLVQPRELLGQARIGLVRQQDMQQPIPARSQVVPGQRAAALAGAGFSEGEQAAQPGPGRAVRGVGEQGGPVRQVQPASSHQAHAGDPRCPPGGHDAGDGVMVGDAEGVDAIGGCLGEQLLRMAGAAEEGVVGRGLQFGVGGHGSRIARWVN